MRIKDEFDVRDPGAARRVVEAHPFATIVTAGLRATHMPCLLDRSAEGLAVLGHVARADPACEQLDGPLLLIFHGPHGYVSAGWYRDETIPTWNNVTLHLRGTPEILPDPLPVLHATVDHFEAAAEDPWSLDRMDAAEVAGMARQLVAFRLRAEAWHLEAKLSQDKPAEDRERIVAGLEGPGPYADAPLAAAMRASAG